MPNLQKPQYVYDPRLRNGLGGFRSVATGRIVPNAIIRSNLFNYIDTKSSDVLSGQLQSGKITLSQWQLSMRDLISDGHITGYTLARGGWLQLTDDDLIQIGRILTREYRYLDAWASQIANGWNLDGRLRVRANLYEQAFYGTYSFAEGRAAELAGATEELSILDPGAKHCGLCIAEADRGWILIGSGIPIGGRTCLSRCRCHKEYR